MEGDMGYHTYLNPMLEGLFSSTHTNTRMQNLFCAKSLPQLWLFINGVNLGFDPPIWAVSIWNDLIQMFTKLGKLISKGWDQIDLQRS